MERRDIWAAAELELRRSKKIYPSWPDHVAAQAGIVCEEAGELMQAALKWKYEKSEVAELQAGQKKRLKVEAIQTMVTAIRFLENLKD